MTSILNGPRTSLDAIGNLLHQNISQNLPGAVQQGYQRQTGMNALDRAEQEIAQANGDPMKIAMAFARAGAQNPNLERSLGPLASAAMSNAKVNNAFPSGPGMPNQNASPSGMGSSGMQGAMQGMQNGGASAQQNMQGVPQETGNQLPVVSQSSFATPSPFNIFSKDQMNAEAERYAKALQDPAAYGIRLNQLQGLNDAATTQRTALEDLALRGNVKPSDLNRYMQVGAQFSPNNPTEWAQKTDKAFARVKSNDDKIQKAFIPGLGSGLLGRDRDAALKRLIPTVQDQVKNNQEQETRNYLADQFVSPTEVEGLIHPLTPSKEKAIKEFPKGDFPAQKEKGSSAWTLPFGIAGAIGEKLFPSNKAKMSYEEMKEVNPQKLQQQQNELANFFLKNVDKETSLLQLENKLWEDRDYDWRQIGPAIRQAQSMGMKLEPFQSTELSDIDTQAPRQSLPDMFQSFDRVIQYFRGNK